MKLLAVLMLTALPLYCYAGIHCKIFKDMIAKTVDTHFSPEEYVNYFQPFITDAETEMAVREFKQCFLIQNAETLKQVIMAKDLIINSVFCDGY